MALLILLCYLIFPRTIAAFVLPPNHFHSPSSLSLAHSRFAAKFISRRDEVDLSIIDFHDASQFTKAQEIVSERLKLFLHNRTTVLEGLKIEVAPTKKTLLLTGVIPPVKITLSKAAVKQLSTSGGAVVHLTSVNFRVPWLFRRYFKPGIPVPRPLRRQMQIFADVVLTVDDIAESAMVRGLVERLVNIIINKPIESLGGEGARVSEIDRVDISRGRIRVSGRTVGLSSSIVSKFSVTFKVEGSKDGRLVIFDDFDLHTTLVGRTRAMKVVDLPKGSIRVELDIGRDARIDKLELMATSFRIAGWCRLSPAVPFRVSNIKESTSFLQYKIDVGAMFSALFGISN